VPVKFVNGSEYINMVAEKGESSVKDQKMTEKKSLLKESI
jgi:hypothetical protein